MSNAVQKNSLSLREATQSPQAQELFHLLIENVIDYAIFTLDIESNITSWNIGAERILGYTEDEVVGQPVSIIFTPEDRVAGADKAELQQAVQTGRAEDEREHLRKDGSRFWALGIMTGLKDENGKLRGWVKILRDFTERKRYEERLERAVAETNHRVKNSLQVACALIELHTLGHEQEGVVSTTSVKSIVNHLKAMVSIQELLTNEVKIDPGVTHLSAKSMLERLLILVQRSVGEKEITYQADELQLPVKLLNSLAILVNELIANAVKHGQGAVHLHMVVETGGEKVRLEVSDNGPGFPEDFSSHNAANTGLELVEGVTQYDLLGRVSYGNRPSGGGCVTVIFPIPPK